MLGAFKGKSGRAPTATESLSLCALKEKVTRLPKADESSCSVFAVRPNSIDIFD
jgi:hypothetical protein